MPDKSESQQQALDNLQNAIKRCEQEGINVTQIQSYLDEQLTYIMNRQEYYSNRTLRIKEPDK